MITDNINIYPFIPRYAGLGALISSPLGDCLCILSNLAILTGTAELRAPIDDYSTHVEYIKESVARLITYIEQNEGVTLEEIVKQRPHVFGKADEFLAGIEKREVTKRPKDFRP